ncbi:MAG: lactate racemase domain-containing protein [Nitrospinota bacterium]
MDSQSVCLPWGAWCEDAPARLVFPADWDISVCEMESKPPLDRKGIEKALDGPFGTRPIEEMGHGKKRVVIAVEDITRPSPFEKVLTPLVERLERAGIRDYEITFLICNGSHAPMGRRELVLKLGESIVERFFATNHNPYDALCDTGLRLGKIPFKVNRLFFEADLRIIAGSIIPHNFAGFSAGAKLVLPGLSDIETLERSHKFVMMGLRGGVNDVENNRFRSELEDAVTNLGIDLFIGAVPNKERDICGLFCGDTVETHRKGVLFAREVFQTTVPEKSDLLILNAYPKDMELLQADTAFTALKSIKRELVSDGGVILLTSRCQNGFGFHSLFGPGMRLYRKPVSRRFLKGRELVFYSPNLNKEEFKKIFWEGYSFFSDKTSLIEYLKERFKLSCRVTVLPYAPTQLLQCHT